MIRVMGLLLILPLLGFQATDEEKARKLLKKAFTLQEKGRFPEAKQIFQYIAQKYPDTKSAETAKERGADNAFLRWKKLVDNGGHLNRLDVVLTGDGYLIDKQRIMDSFAKAVVNAFQSQNRTLKEYFSYFNFYLMNASSKQSGVDTRQQKFDTVFGGTKETGMLHSDYPLVSQMVSKVFPNKDAWAIISIFSASGHSTGGGSMANIAGTGPGPVIHEFGHAFAGLQDEYSNNRSGDGGNVSNQDDPERVDWAHWLKDKELADALGLGVHPIDGGKKYVPTRSCTMQSGGGDFCPVCREAILHAIYSYIRPIDESTEAMSLDWDGKDTTANIHVIPMRPKAHELKVTWTLRKLKDGEVLQPFSEAPATPSAEDPPQGTPVRPRPNSNEVIKIDGKKIQGQMKKDKLGRSAHYVRFSELGLEAGTYAIVVQVTDEPKSRIKTKKRGVIEAPWVLKDPLNLLQERRRWIVTVKK